MFQFYFDIEQSDFDYDHSNFLKLIIPKLSGCVKSDMKDVDYIIVSNEKNEFITTENRIDIQERFTNKIIKNK